MEQVPSKETQPEIAEKVKNSSNDMSQYGRYSAIVTQMLATMGLSFWGAKKLNDYWEVSNNLITVGLGLLGMSLAFYNLLRQLNHIEKNEK